MGDPTVKVRGSGRVWGPPDHAKITIEIKAKAPSETAVFEDVASRSKKLEGVLRELGIPDEAVHSKSVQLRDEHAYGREGDPQVVAENELEVTLPDQEAVGRLITAAIREVDGHVKGLSWELNPDNALHRDVLLMATKNAREKAEVQAEALGVSLGPVLEVSEWEPYRSFEHHDRLGHFTIADESREAAFQIFEGEVQVDASIEVTFGLKEIQM
jgi:uncharacterized protein